MKKAFILVALSFEAALLLWLAVLMGQKLDSQWDSRNAITVTLIILVLIIWFYQLIYFLQKKY